MFHATYLRGEAANSDSCIKRPVERFWQAGCQRTGLLMVLCVTAALVALAALASDRLRSAHSVDPEEAAGSGAHLRSEVLYFWLPHSLAKWVSERGANEIRSGVRYATTIRSHLVNGKHTDLVFMMRTGEAPRYLEEFLGRRFNGQSGETIDYSNAVVNEVDDDLLEREVTELRNHNGTLIAK